mmetsp:Transcript_22666/g.33878  ORF Transcript_22666/g.33878 Transcript_22666/m.33878 type:complete len:247 (+) Transcript_22666:39-779(+)
MGRHRRDHSKTITSISHKQRVQQCKVVAHKARKIVKGAVQKLKRTPFVRTIKQSVQNKNLEWSSNKNRSFRNKLALHTSVAIITSAILGVATGGFVTESIRAGFSVVISNVVSDAVLKRTKRETNKEECSTTFSSRRRPIDKALDEAKKDCLQGLDLISRSTTGPGQATNRKCSHSCQNQSRERDNKNKNTSPIDKILDEAKRGHLHHHFTSEGICTKQPPKVKKQDRDRLSFHVNQNQPVKKKNK